MRLRKEKSELRRPIRNNNRYLAQITVTAAEDITTPDGTVRAEKGTVVDTIVTDTTGIARSKELYLGKYVVKETKQPIGFIRPNQTWDVELKYADQKTELVKENLTIKNQPTEIIIEQKGNRNGQAARRRQICHLEQRQRRSDRSGNAA